MASDEFSEWFIAADKRNWTCSERVARAAFAAGRAAGVEHERQGMADLFAQVVREVGEV